MFKKHWILCDEAGEAIPAGAPASAPQSEAPAVDDSFDSGDADWADLSGEAGEGGEGYTDDEPAAEPPEPAAPAEPAVALPVEPLAAEQLAAQPETLAPETPAVPYTPEQVKQAEQQYVAQLVGLYQFDEETALRLQTEPEKVLPSLAAKLHMDVMRTVLAQVNGMLPQVMERQNQSTARESKAKGEFFTAWPELQKYEAQVLEVGKMYRQMNPTAPAAEAIQRIGEVAMTALGLSREAPVAPPPTQTPSGFRPAVPGRVNPPSANPSLWEEMATDDD